MKRNYFIAVAVAALMLATTVAQAADISFSGQFRPRFNIANDTTDVTDSRQSFDTRVRLNAKANVNANTEVFLQFQSKGIWGNATGSTNGGSRVGNTAASINDDLADVGFHQAYVTLKNFMGKAVDAKIGRQEVVLDGHRLFGHTGWTTGGASVDAIRLDHSAGNHDLNFIYIASDENGSESALQHDNYNLYVFRGATQGVMGGSLSGYFVISDDESASAEIDDNNTWYTIGARQKGKMGGLDYRVEYYYQFGDGAVTATSAEFSGAYDAATNSQEIDRSAHMFGVRVGKTFKNAAMSPTITLWFDSLSGTDDDDVSSQDMGTFNTLQDTGHKFYGFMDNYLNGAGTGTNHLGLVDVALKTKWKVSDTNTFKADFHHFETQTDINSNDSDTIRTNSATAANGSTGTMEGDMGQ